MDKYIIYTMKNEKIVAGVEEILFSKGYIWYAGQTTPQGYCSKTIGINIWREGTMSQGDEMGGEVKEITFRELMELPSVNDNVSELSELIFETIKQWWNKDGVAAENAYNSMDWCKVQEKVKKKLGL